MKNYRIGLLGGIGPISTGIFYDLLINKLQKSGHIKSNTDFPNIIINSIPAPALTSLNMPEEVIEPYIDGVRLLQSLEPDLMFMVCNTIHVYFDKVKTESQAKNIVSIRDCVQKKMEEKYMNKKICVLGTPLTVTCGLYQYSSLEYINPNVEELGELGSVIDDYNSTGNPKSGAEKLQILIEKKKREGAEIFLYACTEISALGRSLQNVPFEDTIEIMADYIIEQFLLSKKQNAA